MARTSKKQGKPAGKPRKKQQPKAYWLGTLIFLSALLVIFSAFLSMQLAFVAIGFVTIAGLGIYELKNRRFWETAHDFKIRLLSEKHDGLVREVVRNQNDIKKLKKRLEIAANKIDEQDALFKTEHLGQKQQIKEMARAMKESAFYPRATVSQTKQSEVLDLEVMPRFLSNPPKTRASRPMRGTLVADNDYQKKSDEQAFEDHRNYSDMVVRELVNSAIELEQIEVFAQPIVRLPQRKVRSYEMFARIRAKPGLYIPAERYMHIANRNEAMKKIDLMLLTNCLRTIVDTVHIKNATPFFINVSTNNLKSAQYMGKLLAFLKNHKHLAHRLILEIRQDDFEDMQPAVLEILRGLGRLGCNLSLDHVERLDFDIKFLQVLKVRYVKIEAKTFIAKTRNDKHYRELLNTKRKLEGNGIGVIVEKIENEFSLKEILDFDIQHGQGYLFGKPEPENVYKDRKAA